MYAQQQQRLEAVAKWAEAQLKQRAAALAPLGDQDVFAQLIEDVRQQFYSDYSLWHADYDLVERVVYRLIRARTWVAGK